MLLFYLLRRLFGPYIGCLQNFLYFERVPKGFFADRISLNYLNLKLLEFQNVKALEMCFQMGKLLPFHLYICLILRKNAGKC